MKRKLFLLPIIFSAAVLAGVLFALPAAGATVNAPGLILSAEGDTPAAVPGGTAVLPDDAAIAVNGNAEKAERSEDGRTVSVVLIGEDTAGRTDTETKKTAMLSVTEDVDLSAFGALSANVLLSPAGDRTVSSCVLTVSLYTDRDILRFRADLFPGSVKTVTFDVTSLEDRSSVRRITASLEWENVGEDPGTIVFSKLYGMAGSKTPNASMSSLSLSSGSGKMTATGSSLTLTAQNGAAELYALIDPEALPVTEAAEGTVPVRYAALTLVSNGGSVSAELNGGADRDQGHAVIAQTRRTFEGEHVYLFRFVSDEVQTLKITFQSPGGGSVTCKSLEFFSAGSHDPAADYFGCTIEGEVRGSTLTVDGKIKKSASVELSGKKLGLFTVPAAGGEKIKLAECKSGSAFSFSVPLSSLQREGRENLFWVSALEEDGEVPISEKQFLFNALPSEGGASVAGLYGAEPAGVFEAGMSRAVVDVDLDRLTEDSRKSVTGLVAIRDSETYYLNSDYVRALDSEMEFYEASGIGVYLKFAVDDPARWFGDAAGKSSGDPRGLSLYLALTSFLSGRYRNVVSIVIPDVKGIGSLWEDACSAALLARLTFAAASLNYESLTVTVPAADLGDGEGGETFAAFVAESLHQIGEIPWSIFTVSDKSTFDGLDVPITSSRANGTAAPSFSVLLLTPEGKTAEEAAQIFLGLCRKGRETGSRAVILSLPSVSGSGLLDYSILRGSGGHGDVTVRETEDYSSVGQLVVSSEVLWDFTDSYSTEGWVAGSGIGSFGTAFFSGRSGDRVLHATLEAESSHGIILRTFPETVNFSLFPLIEFELSVSSDDGTVVTFMFSTSGGDVEYVLDCPPGKETRRVVCDLSDLPGTGGVNGFTVFIRSEGTATADIFRITAHSKTETKGTVRIDGPSAGEGEPGGGLDRRTVYVPIAAAVVMIPIGIHLFRSDRDASFAKARRREREK